MDTGQIIVPEKKIITNPSLADRAVTFISALKHTKGEWHGKNFELLPWQETIVRDVFGTVTVSYTHLIRKNRYSIRISDARLPSALRVLHCWR